MSIGSQIARRRKELKINQKTLADKVGVSYQAVSCWERDEYLPETDRLIAIAAALNTKVSWLLEEDEFGSKRWALRDEMFSIERMLGRVSKHAEERKLSETKKALELMQKHHEGQVRKGKDAVPYIVHPLMMACHAFALGLVEDDLIASILLHDVVEDCDVTPEELDVNDKIREAVRLVSFKKIDGKTKEEAKKLYYESISYNRLATIVKLLDRCNNVSTMATGFSKKRIADYIDETETYVIPLLDMVKHEYDDYSNAAFLLKYQMRSVMETLKRTI